MRAPGSPGGLDEARQALGRDGRVFDERGRALRAGGAHEQRQHRASQGAASASESAPPGHRPAHAELAVDRAQPAEAGAGLVLAALVLDGQHRLFVAAEQRLHAPEVRQVGGAAQRLQVEELDGGRAGGEDGDVGLQGAAQGGEGQRGAHAQRRARIQSDLELGVTARASPRSRRAVWTDSARAIEQRRAGRSRRCSGASAGSRRRSAGGAGADRLQLGRQPVGGRAAQPVLQVGPRAGAEAHASRRRRARPRRSPSCRWSRRRRWSASRTSCCRPCRRWSPGRRWRCPARTPGRTARRHGSATPG